MTPELLPLVVSLLGSFIVVIVVLIVFKKLSGEVFLPMKKLATKGFESIILTIHKLFQHYIPIMVHTLKDQFEGAMYVRGTPLGQYVSDSLKKVHDTLNSRANEIQSSLGSLHSKVDQHTSNFTQTSVELNNKLSKLESELRQLQEFIKELSKRVDQNTTGIERLNHSVLDTIHKVEDMRLSLADARDVLDRTLARLEDFVNRLAQISQDLFTLHVAVSRLERQQDTIIKLSAEVAEALTMMPAFEKAVKDTEPGQKVMLLKKLSDLGVSPSKAAEMLDALDKVIFITPEEEERLRLKLKKLELKEAFRMF